MALRCRVIAGAEDGVAAESDRALGHGLGLPDRYCASVGADGAVVDHHRAGGGTQGSPRCRWASWPTRCRTGSRSPCREVAVAVHEHGAHLVGLAALDGTARTRSGS